MSYLIATLTGMTTTRPARRTAPVPLPEGFATRLHATTALSRLMRGDHEGARELLSGLTRAEVAEIARDSERLAATARLVLADLTSGAA